MLWVGVECKDGGSHYKWPNDLEIMLDVLEGP